MAQLVQCVSNISAKLLTPMHEFRYVLKDSQLVLVQKPAAFDKKRSKNYVNPFCHELFVEPSVLVRIDGNLQPGQLPRSSGRDIVYSSNPFT